MMTLNPDLHARTVTLEARIAELERQRDDLQAANNALLERARKAERSLAHCCGEPAEGEWR